MQVQPCPSAFNIALGQEAMYFLFGGFSPPPTRSPSKSQKVQVVVLKKVCGRPSSWSGDLLKAATLPLCCCAWARVGTGGSDCGVVGDGVMSDSSCSSSTASSKALQLLLLVHQKELLWYLGDAHEVEIVPTGT